MKQTNRIFFIVLAILLPLLCGGSVFFLTRNVPAACIVLGLSALQVLFTAWQRHREQAYWRSVAAQLSDLCDCLLFLEHREIFPRNEDTVLSKLQDKVLKLVTILQQKNEDSRQAQENLCAIRFRRCFCRESHWWFRRLFHLCRIRSKH